jgi:hypothetical protein
VLFRHLTDPQTGAPSESEDITHIWIRGPELPEDVEADGLLTAEDLRDLTLDHIARTCETVVHFHIVKRS